ncbi:hypothetical protein [Novosphingobium sp. FSW06-99]|uniref:hypothetical protein n=1 Tax=Novosphingobium sp. FSW06-99 TaxID=1739113 RepID=UPI001E637D64|nr:hypothetical protein [Novosphingobium sp. FSW06-99]
MPMPRMLIDWESPASLTVSDGEANCRSAIRSTAFFSSAAPDSAVAAIGTVWRFWVLRSAVTTISASPLPGSSDAADAAEGDAADAADWLAADAADWLAADAADKGTAGDAVWAQANGAPATPTASAATWATSLRRPRASAPNNSPAMRPVGVAGANAGSGTDSRWADVFISLSI